MSAEDLLNLPAPPPARTVRLGPGEHEVYDVYEPPAPPSPGPVACVVLLHGGFWRAGYDRTHLRPLASWLAGQGHLAVLVEYRRTGMAGGGWPGTGLDVAAAVAAVRARETTPQTPVVLVGHSAGGQLALWALHQPAGAGVCGAVVLAGCLDLALVQELDLGDGAARELLGGIPPDRDQVRRAADPAHLGPAPSAVQVLHGGDDQIVPVQVSRSWWARAAVPERDRMRVLEGAGHLDLIDPRHPATDHLHRAVIDLVFRFAP